METKNKYKKMTNEGQESKVPYSSSIGLVFVIGLVVGAMVIFLAVAGRTEGIIQQRRELLAEKKAREAAALVKPDNRSEEAPPASTGDAAR